MRSVREKLEIALRRRGFTQGTGRNGNLAFINHTKPGVEYTITDDGELWCNYRSQLKATMLAEVKDVDAAPKVKKFDPLQLLD